MHARLKRVPLIIIPLALVAAAVWFYMNRGSAQAEQGPVTASGTIEATQVMVAPEIGGQVLEVLVNDGQTVKAGQELVRFSDALIQAQLAQAQAAVAQAETNYQLVASGPADEQQELAIAAAKLELTSAQQALQTLYDTADLARAQVEQRVAAAANVLDKAKDHVDSIKGESDPEDIERAQANVVITQDALKKTKEDYDRVLKYYKRTNNKNVGRAYQQIKLSNAQDAYDHAVTVLTNLLGHANELDLAVAEADAKVAEAQLADAQRELEKVKGGPDPDALALAQARLAAAKAKLSAAQAGASPEQLALAKSQVEVARAAAGVIEAQMNKLVLLAPMDGLVLSRSVEAGEVVVPGTPLLTLAKPTDMTITVYVPEDRYGMIELGQKAQVNVDSFPGQVFDASVVHIAGQAEFTPRNVQTEEGRRTTVYAIKLQLENPDGRLKPGMPADVEFEGL
jgi:multidrug resistance efflux pump